MAILRPRRCSCMRARYTSRGFRPAVTRVPRRTPGADDRCARPRGGAFCAWWKSSEVHVGLGDDRILGGASVHSPDNSPLGLARYIKGFRESDRSANERVEGNPSRRSDDAGIVIRPWPRRAGGLEHGFVHRLAAASPTLPRADAVSSTFESGEWRSGSAPALGAGGRGFKSPLPDPARGCSSMAEPQTSNLMTRVRFSSPAPDPQEYVGVATGSARE